MSSVLQTVHRANAEVDRLAELLAGQRIGMLATVSPQGEIESKPMALVEFDAEGDLWFFCQPGIGDQQRYQRLNVSFSDERHSTFISVVGSGEIVRDSARIRALWSPMLVPWFPGGPDAPSLALLKVHCDRAEYWDGPDSRLVRGIAIAASIVSGKPIGVGAHDVITPPQPQSA